MCFIPRLNNHSGHKRGLRNTLSEEDRNKLVCGHVDMVKWVVGNLIRQDRLKRHLAEEALGEGYLGLVKASHSYNPELSAFRTYAPTYIAGHILGWQRKELNKHGKEIPVSFLAARGVDGQTHPGGNKEEAFLDDVTVPEEDRAHDEVEYSDLKKHLLSQLPQLLDQLAPKVRRALELLYLEGRTPQEAADEMGLCRQRIYQLRDKALSQLYKLSREQGLR